MSASEQCIPQAKSRAREMPGWTDHVKPERELSLFWHWIWLESGKPNTGFVYQIMKRTRHQYHYAIRCCKKNKIRIQKEKLAENISNSNDFWREIKKINPANKVTTCVMDNVKGDTNITNIFFNKYKSLYNSVPTSDSDMLDLYTAVNEGVNLHQLQNIVVTPEIIARCVKRLKKGKDDGNRNFKSDHIINAGHRYYIYLSLLFNCMLGHGYYAGELIRSI